MPVRRNSRKKWIYRTIVKLRDGSKVRIFGTPERNTRESAEQAERDHIARVQNPVAPPVDKRKVPTFAEWFWGPDADAEDPSGRFWREWVIAEKNKPSEMEAKIDLSASPEIGFRPNAPRRYWSGGHRAVSGYARRG